MGNWFAQFWLQLEGAASATTTSPSSTGWTPSTTPRASATDVLFQWAGEDVFIGQDVRDAYAAIEPATPR